MALTKEQILSNSKPAVKEIEIPELESTAFIRVMTGQQRDEFETMVTTKNTGNLRGTVAAWVLCDEGGNRLFEDRDAVELGQKDVRFLTRIFDATVELSALSQEEIKAVEGN